MKLAFFDLDHTLMRNPFWPAVFPYIGSRLSAMARVSEREAINRVIETSARWQRAGELRSHDWDEVVRTVGSELGVRWTEPVADIVVANLEGAECVPGAPDALSAAKRDGWSAVIASQGFRRYQEPVVRHLGLWEHFDRALFSDEVGMLKRNRKFYGEIPPSATRVVAIGDLLIDDVLYPQRFNFTPVWFTGVRRQQRILCGERPRFEIDSLIRLSGVLAEISSDAACAYSQEADGKRCKRCGGPANAGPLCELCRCVEQEERRPVPEEAA